MKVASSRSNLLIFGLVLSFRAVAGTEEPNNNNNNNDIPNGCEDYCDAMIPLETGWPDLYMLRGGGEGSSSSTNNNFAGQTLCIPPGHHWALGLHNIWGLAEAPVTIQPCGSGIVTFDGQKPHPITNATRQGTPIRIKNCKHIRLTGLQQQQHNTNNDDDDIGMIAENAQLHGIHVDGGSTFIEIDHVESRNHGYAGIVVRTYPECGGQYIRSNFVQRNTSIHHCTIRNVGGEGMYIGTSHYHLDDGGYVYGSSSGAACPGETAAEGSLRGVHIYQNDLSDIELDAIQIGAAVEDVQVHHNTIKRFATKHQYGHSNGIGMNPGSTGDIYENWIEGNDPTSITTDDNYQEPVVAIAFYGQAESYETSLITNNVIQHVDVAFAFYNREDAVNQSYIFTHNIVSNFTGNSPIKVYCLGTMDPTQQQQVGPVHVTVEHNVFALGLETSVLEEPNAGNNWRGYKGFYGNTVDVDCLDYVATQQRNLWALAMDDVVTIMAVEDVTPDSIMEEDDNGYHNDWWHPGLFNYEGIFYYCNAKDTTIVTGFNCTVGLAQYHNYDDTTLPASTSRKKNLLALLLKQIQQQSSFDISLQFSNELNI